MPATVTVQGSAHFPTDDEAFMAFVEGGPSEYVLPYRGGETVFRLGPDVGTWEVVAYNKRGDLLWSVSTALWDSETFAQARVEACAFSHFADD